jgi:D-lactate dehydrogenase (cytochrome)
MFQSHIPVDFLRDESRTSGTAAAIAFPQSVAELSAALREAAARGLAVTLQGARTGISAGAVPDGGAVVSLTKMDRILGLHADAAGRALLRVQPGVPLVAVRRFLAEAGRAGTLAGPYVFPTDPTETSASLGGMAACNASGACSYAYGPTRNHIEGLAVVLADGDTLTLRRGQASATGSRFSLMTDGGRTISGELPAYALPSVKNAAGYWVRPDMDLLDLFIGSEGTLGAIAELDLRLTPKPHRTLGVLCFLRDEAQSLDLVEALRNHQQEANPHTLVALEYFDEGALRLIRAGAPHTGLLLPPARPHWRCALYVEWALTPEGDTPGPFLARLLDACASHADDTWVAADAPSLDKLKAFRHAAPEQVNALIALRKRDYPSLTKLGTDLSVPDGRLREVMSLYRRDLQRAGLEHVVFGHIGNNHVHVNILPRDMAEYAAGKALYRSWAEQVVAWGGSVSAEHGIGRLKKELLAAMYGAEGIAAMRRLKRLFDPENRLNPGRLF